MGCHGGSAEERRASVPQLNRVLDDAGFDTFVEAQCAQCYADGLGRPSLAPGSYFRLLLLGYFEGLDSERAIAWRAADSLSIRQFLDFATRRRRTIRPVDVETHQAVFTWVLQRLADAHLVEGPRLGSTRRRSKPTRRCGASWSGHGRGVQAWLTRLAKRRASRRPRGPSWRGSIGNGRSRGRTRTGASAPDAKITKMKDGRTHLAHTAEHAVDLEAPSWG